MGDPISRRRRGSHPAAHTHARLSRHLRPVLDQRQLQRPDPRRDRPQRHAPAQTSRPLLRFNNDSGGNDYTGEQIKGGGGTTLAASELAGQQITCGDTPGPSSLANSFSVHTITVFGYASTTWLKTVLIESAYANFTTANQRFRYANGFTWNSTAAVTRVQFAANGSGGFDNFVTGSQLRIYGRL